MNNQKAHQLMVLVFTAGLSWNTSAQEDVESHCKDQNSKIFGLFLDSTAAQSCIGNKLTQDRAMIDQQYFQYPQATSTSQGALEDAVFRDLISQLDRMKQQFDINQRVQTPSLFGASKSAGTVSTEPEENEDRETHETAPGFVVKGKLE